MKARGSRGGFGGRSASEGDGPVGRWTARMRLWQDGAYRRYRARRVVHRGRGWSGRNMRGLQELVASADFASSGELGARHSIRST